MNLHHRPAFIIPFPLFVDSGRPPIPHLNDSISPAPAEAGPSSSLWFIGYLVVLVLSRIPRGCFKCAKHMSDEHEKLPQESGPNCKPVTEVYAASLYAFASSFLSQATAIRLKTGRTWFLFINRSVALCWLHERGNS